MMTRKIHPCARTNAALRRELQESFGTNKARASRLGLNLKTIAKWRSRPTVCLAIAPLGNDAVIARSRPGDRHRDSGLAQGARDRGRRHGLAAPQPPLVRARRSRPANGALVRLLT
jgi:hypothetical protein